MATGRWRFFPGSAKTAGTTEDDVVIADKPPPIRSRLQTLAVSRGNKRRAEEDKDEAAPFIVPPPVRRAKVGQITVDGVATGMRVVDPEGRPSGVYSSGVADSTNRALMDILQRIGITNAFRYDATRDASNQSTDHIRQQVITMGEMLRRVAEQPLAMLLPGGIGGDTADALRQILSQHRIPHTATDDFSVPPLTRASEEASMRAAVPEYGDTPCANGKDCVCNNGDLKIPFTSRFVCCAHPIISQKLCVMCARMFITQIYRRLSVITRLTGSNPLEGYHYQLICNATDVDGEYPSSFCIGPAVAAGLTVRTVAYMRNSVTVSMRPHPLDAQHIIPWLDQRIPHVVPDSDMMGFHLSGR